MEGKIKNKNNLFIYLFVKSIDSMSSLFLHKIKN